MRELSPEMLKIVARSLSDAELAERLGTIGDKLRSYTANERRSFINEAARRLAKRGLPTGN